MTAPKLDRTVAGGTVRQRRRRNPTPPPPGPGRPSDLDKQYTWPGTAPGEQPQVMTVDEAIPRWIRTTGCLWQEAVLAVGITITTAENWLRIGARADRSMIAGRLETDLTDHERRCLAFSRALLTAAAETVTRWQSILERESRGGFPITRTTVTEKLDPQGNIIERTNVTTTEYARPDTQVLRWRMAKMLPMYRDRPSVVVNVGDQVVVGDVDDAELARDIADDFRRFAAQPAPAIEVSSTVSGENAKSPRAGDRPATTDSAKGQVDS